MQSNFPLISIITPSFNKGEFIEETIESIQNQTYTNIEHIIMDGLSSDQTISILKKYEKKISWISKKDSGQTDAINKGLIRSQGVILAYLNADDTYLPNTIETIVNYFSSHPDIDLVYGDIIHINEKSEEIEYIKTGQIQFLDYLCGRFYLPQPTIFFRRNVFEKLGLFDINLDLAMDLDYWITVLSECRVDYIPQYLAKARIYPDAKSSALKYRYLKERIYILNKFFSDPKNKQKYSKVTAKIFSSNYIIGGIDHIRDSTILSWIKIFNKGIFYSSPSYF